MILNRRLYVCQLCNRAYCHYIINCFSCPGKTKAQDFEYDSASRASYSQEAWDKWLSERGLLDGGI